MAYTSKDNFLPVRSGASAVPRLPELDIMQMSLANLMSELQQTVDKKRPVIFKGWGNRRMELDSRRQDLIIEQIRGLGLAVEVMAETAAKVFLSQQLFEAKLADFASGLQMAARQFKDNLQKIDDEAKSRELQLREKESRIVLDDLRGRAEVDLIKAQTAETAARAKMMITLVKKIQEDNKPLPDFLLSLIGAAVFGSKQEITSDLHLMDKMQEYILREADAKAKATEASAVSVQSQAYMDKETAKVNVKNLRDKFK